MRQATCWEALARETLAGVAAMIVQQERQQQPPRTIYAWGNQTDAAARGRANSARTRRESRSS
jgi:hypothetical protein